MRTEDLMLAAIGLLPKHPKPMEVNQTQGWLHPAYVACRVDVSFGKILLCPITHTGFASAYSFPLTRSGYMIPEFTIHP